MKRLSVLLVLAALASFALYWVERPTSDAAPTERIRLVQSGLAWVDGNQSSAFFVLNATRPARVDVDVLAERVPTRVWIWNESDQARFDAFAQRLERRLAGQSISVARARRSDLQPDEPAVLVIAASAMPDELLRDDFLPDLLEHGWVAVYSGFPFSWVRRVSRIEPNAAWPSQRERLGLDFDRTEATADFGVSVRRGSLQRVDSWQVFRREPGVLAFWPGLLDASYSDADATAEHVADFIAHARWSPAVVSFSANVSSAQTVFSPVFSDPAQQALVFTTDNDSVRRGVLDWSEPSVKIIHPARMRSNATVLVSILSNLSSAESLELSVVRDGQRLKRHALGVFPPGLSWRSFPLETPVLDGDYVLDVFGSSGTRAYSMLRVYSYHLEVSRADAASRSVTLRLWAGNQPASGRMFQWLNQTVQSDSDGYARLTDPDFSGGIHRRDIRLDGQNVAFEYSVQNAFLSSWTDRVLLLATAGLFGFAWFWQRRLPQCIRLTPASIAPVHRVVVRPAPLGNVLDAARARLKRGADVLSVREFRDGLERFLCGPTCAFTDESVDAFLSQAASSRHAYWENGFVAWRTWYASEAGFREAVFWRRLSDALILRGWTFRRSGVRVFCRKGDSRMSIRVTPREGRIRPSGSKKDVTLDAWCNRLDA